MSLMIFRIFIFLSVLSLTGCFRDPKYRRTNHYEAMTTPTIMRSQSVPVPHLNSDRIFYQFFAYVETHSPLEMKFKIEGISQEPDPKIKLLAKQARIIYPGGKTELISGDDTFFIVKPAPVKPNHLLEPLYLTMKTPPRLNWGEKLLDDEAPAIPTFTLEVPVEIKEYQFQPNGLPVFDSAGHDVYKRKQVWLSFSYETRPIPGEDKVNKRLFYQAY